MGVVTFAQELESPIAPDRLFKALMLDSHVLFPKLIPQHIKSIDLVKGDGGVGSVRQTNFAQESLLKYATHRIDELDADNFRCKYTLIEGDILSDGLKSVVYEIEFVDDGNGGSICRMSSYYCSDRDIELRDEDIEAGKDRAMELYRAVEAYLLALECLSDTVKRGCRACLGRLDYNSEEHRISHTGGEGMEKDESPEATATVAVNFGRSIIVPSVQELARKPIVNLPPRYLRCSDDEDPPLVSGDASESVPVVDVQRLARGDPLELEKLHFACKDWGFFQIVNHGVSVPLLEEFKREIESFFELPYEEKQKLWQQPENHEGFGQLFVVSEEQKLDWSDMFYITTLPLGLRKADLFKKLPENLRNNLEAYSLEVKKLALLILGHMARALKMDAEEIRELFGDGVQAMRMNYYPPCPQPDMAIGFTPHSDAVALTILFQLNETEGLQIRKEGRWVPVKPLHNAFVVNIGDIMEIVSNGIYQSIEHRATVNSTKERLSIATFYSCRLDTVLGPAPSLISSDNPAIFRRVPVEAYFKEFFNRKLKGKSYLDFMRTAGAF